MWYKVPETKPKPTEQPKPIFPWEEKPDRPKTSRVFAEDVPSEPSPVFNPPTHVFSTVHYEEEDVASSETPTNHVVAPQDVSPSKYADDPWQAFQLRNTNAWDSVPGIENYVRTMVDSQGQRGTTRTSQQTVGTGELNSPRLERRTRRESLILTDFPSAIERPSLPVTPAPLRRPSFWGEERNRQGELPSATGVPEQQEWVCPQSAFSFLCSFVHHPSHESSLSGAIARGPSLVSSVLRVGRFLGGVRLARLPWKSYRTEQRVVYLTEWHSLLARVHGPV